MSGVLVLLSGGIDSATVLAMLRDHQREAVGFRYGQKHVCELDYAAVIAEREGVSFTVVDIPEIPKLDDVVFAGRNAILISMGAAIAKARGLDAVAIGSNFSDWERFPDCRPDFIRPLREALEYGYKIMLAAPVLRMSKAQIVDEAKRLGMPLEETWSCYGSGPVPCGECLACVTRKAAGA